MVCPAVSEKLLQKINISLTCCLLMVSGNKLLQWSKFQCVREYQQEEKMLIGGKGVLWEGRHSQAQAQARVVVPVCGPLSPPSPWPCKCPELCPHNGVGILPLRDSRFFPSYSSLQLLPSSNPVYNTVSAPEDWLNAAAKPPMEKIQ